MMLTSPTLSVPAMFSTPGVNPPIRREPERVDSVLAGRFRVRARIPVPVVAVMVTPLLALVTPVPERVPPDHVNAPATLIVPDPPRSPDRKVRVEALAGVPPLNTPVPPPATSVAPRESTAGLPVKVVVPPEKRVTPVTLYDPENVAGPPVKSMTPAPAMAEET